MSNIYATQDLKLNFKIEINVLQYSNTCVSSGGISFFFSGGSLTKIIFSTGSVSTNGTSINSNAGQYADLVKRCETIL